ncbi:hypothetical protein [Adhaeribacter radiodurans]|uniref:Uncharacterized protein n=1 Tax=Adhaeribacter radiodurans TaxID=2745197 RepID=A0A7L7L420_9BACT|nr:hypothetical protein [Adhaeribacter radiodurans]QMU27546.1 hypothetical protein HUW48_05605 [Adhaeribacter radiodurans]
MSGSEFELLLQRALHTAQPNLFDQPVATVFQSFDRVESRSRQGGPANTELHFSFEKIRLGVAIALMQIFTDLGGEEVSANVLSVLKKAAKATSIGQIDSIIQKENKVFDKLFQNLYTNTEGELILDLFARALEADSRREMGQIVKETLRALETLEFPSDEDE